MDFEGRTRVVIEGVWPQIDCGEFPVKRVVGETVSVQADIFADGHDSIDALLLYKTENSVHWQQQWMSPMVNDRWEAHFSIQELVDYRYTITAWVDPFRTWQRDFLKKLHAGQDIEVDTRVGLNLIEQAARSDDPVVASLKEAADAIAGETDRQLLARRVESAELSRLMRTFGPRRFAHTYARELRVSVERPKALFSSWYELFPRSFGQKPFEHGTFRDCVKQLDRIAKMGFDIVYLPPIHPIGISHRKGKNNSTTARPGEPGSPWAIGSEKGGHDAVHPRLGSVEDFALLLQSARSKGIDIAIDLALQCSPDHPWVHQHPEWFKRRPDGTIQYAENPPKKYEDIVPINFETDQWESLWVELRRVVLFWAEKGVRIIRVDNPHTKPFAFWQWLIAEVRKCYPDMIFLSEAFTRPKVMYRLAKAGFSQSYTYFTWRNTKRELTQYMEELIDSPAREFFRPNFWPNTPDILPEYLQYSGRSGFIIRLVLAATLSSNYGMYGPAYELMAHDAVEGREEYLDSEKYEIKNWNLEDPESLEEIVTMINHIRRQNKALKSTWNLRFHEVDNDYILFYSKATPDLQNILMMVVNLDPFHTQSGWVRMPLQEFGIDPAQTYLMNDLISRDHYLWQGERNFVQLNPHVLPAHIFHVRRRLRRESDFDYFM
ncbi:MAG: alpha-1,4-glucan--maltose-1-phosphate maltosyltransferase [Chitinivibrionales bacterium]